MEIEGKYIFFSPKFREEPYTGYRLVLCGVKNPVILGYVKKSKGTWRAITPKDAVVATHKKTRHEAVEALYYQYFGHRIRK